MVPPRSLPAEKTRYTPQQYLALERKAACRSEYHEGWICAKIEFPEEASSGEGEPVSSPQT
jgi:hypothetical protein